MRALLLGITLGTALVLAACVGNSGQAPTSKNATASGKSEPRMVCHEEASTGSMFTHTVCRSPEQVEDDRNQSQEFVRRQRSGPSPDPSATPSGGPH
jgi:ABC-type Fe3+-hydroxamate transport system substrate-binding protein